MTRSGTFGVLGTSNAASIECSVALLAVGAVAIGLTRSCCGAADADVGIAGLAVGAVGILGTQGRSGHDTTLGSGIALLQGRTAAILLAGNGGCSASLATRLASMAAWTFFVGATLEKTSSHHRIAEISIGTVGIGEATRGFELEALRLVHIAKAALFAIFVFCTSGDRSIDT